MGRVKSLHARGHARCPNRIELSVSTGDGHATTRALECDRLRSFSTTRGSTATTRSIWSTVFSIPRLKRIAFCVR